MHSQSRRPLSEEHVEKMDGAIEVAFHGCGQSLVVVTFGVVSAKCFCTAHSDLLTHGLKRATRLVFGYVVSVYDVSHPVGDYKF